MRLRTFGTLFAGVGGSCLGMSRAGLMQLYASDWNKKALDIHKANIKPECWYHHENVINLDFDNLPKVDILWASPTCCNFSAAKHGRSEESTDIMFSSCIVDAAKHSQVVIVENVVGYSNSTSYAMLCNMLSAIGYGYKQARILNAIHFGNPAQRNRLYLVFSRRRMPYLDFTKYLNQTRWFDALLENRDLWEPKELTAVQKKTLEGHERTEPYAIERCGYYKSPHIVNEYANFPCIKSHTGHDGKAAKDGEGKIGSYRLSYNFCHEGESYAISPSLLGVLNGFPADWDWLDHKGQAVGGIGNAVVPKMAEMIGTEVKRHGSY